VIYRWLSSNDFLLHSIVPEATVIEGTVNDRVEDIVARMPDDAACFHFHLNCTVTERFPTTRGELIQQLRAKDIVPINEGLTDTSKRAIQRKCAELGLNTTAAAPEGDEDELIIVKTDLNFGGDSEWALSSDERSTLGIVAGSDIIWKPDHYRVVPRRDVDPSWWTDPSLVCEKYISNRDNRWYRANFFFSHLVLRELFSESQIKKVGQSTMVAKWNIDIDDLEGGKSNGDYPALLVDALIRFARGFAADFAAVDVMVNDDADPFIIDVNTTPAMLAWPIPGLADYLREALSAD
jgi:hypothetical protein